MIYDISPEISPNLDVWPGDTPFSRTILLDLNEGDNLTLSGITTSLHLGAHTDAPNHYAKTGADIASCSLDPYLGLCQIIEVSTARGKRISLSDFNVNEVREERVLFRTNSFDPFCWNNDFCAFSPDVITALADRNICLVGIDTPSVDLFDDKQLLAHTEIYANKMSILEGIVLTEVPIGVYELIALPLKIKDADASPVRAILRTPL